MEKISRKGFLKIAAAAAMSSVTAAGLAACNAASSSTAAASSGAAGIYTPGTYTATAKGMSENTTTETNDAATLPKEELDQSGETARSGAVVNYCACVIAVANYAGIEGSHKAAGIAG